MDSIAPTVPQALPIKQTTSVESALNNRRPWWKKWQVWVGVVALGLAVACLWWPMYQPSSSGLWLEAEKVTVGKGQQQAVTLYARSNQPVNALDATITYPADKAKTVGVSTEGSRFDLVLFPPETKEAGKIRFLQATVIPFSEASGKVATITFESTDSASFTPQITAVTMTANDGEGTNLYSPDSTIPLWQWLWERMP